MKTVRFKHWLESNDRKELAQQLRVDPSTISRWYTRETMPCSTQLIKIKKLSRNSVDFNEVVSWYAAAQK